MLDPVPRAVIRAAQLDRAGVLVARVEHDPVRRRTLPCEQLGVPAGPIVMHPASIEYVFYSCKLVPHDSVSN